MSPSYQKLASLRQDASWMTDYTLGDYTVVAIGPPLDENFWHLWDTLKVWRSGLVERMVICPESQEDQQWIEDRCLRVLTTIRPGKPGHRAPVANNPTHMSGR